MRVEKKNVEMVQRCLLTKIHIEVQIHIKNHGFRLSTNCNLANTVDEEDPAPLTAFVGMATASNWCSRSSVNGITSLFSKNTVTASSDTNSWKIMMNATTVVIDETYPP